MGHLFISEDLVNPYILAVDILLSDINDDKVWHRSSMKKGIVPCSGLTQMQDGVSVIQEDGYLDTNCI